MEDLDTIFVYGFIFKPYCLRFKIFKEVSTKYENCSHGMTTVKNYVQITLLKIKSEKLFRKIQDWKSLSGYKFFHRIKVFIIRCVIGE